MRGHSVHGTGEDSPCSGLIDKSHLRGDTLQMLEGGSPSPYITQMLDESVTTILLGEVGIKLGLTRWMHLSSLQTHC